MFIRISRGFVTLLTTALLTVPVMAGEARSIDSADPKKCETEKSLLVNISTQRPRGVQVALLVAFANASGEKIEGEYFGGQEAEVHIFLSDAAAPYAIDMDTLTDRESRALNVYLQDEFGYGVQDVTTLQLGGALPGITSLQAMGARVYACNLCVMETLAAITELDDQSQIYPEDFVSYLLPGVEVMTPSNFAVMYDRVTKKPRCNISAAVISF